MSLEKNAMLGGVIAIGSVVASTGLGMIGMGGTLTGVIGAVVAGALGAVMIGLFMPQLLSR